MTIDTRALERELHNEKTGLRTNLQSIGTRASEAVDWRHRVRTHPVEMLGIAAAVGVVVGVLTARSAARGGERRAGSRGPRPASRTSATLAPEWSRLKAGLAAMVADRAIVAAKDFFDGTMRRRRT
ncbi:hypothetical protein [Gemmatimonas sp.]